MMKTHAFVLVMAFLACLSINLFAQSHEGEKGDVNNDGAINVLDVLAAVNHILGTVMLDEQGIWRADVNGPAGNCDGDGAINVLDALKIVNIILGTDECPGTSCTTVTDIDGNTYQTVQIGDQCWMAENLKVTHYRDGDPIEECWSYGDDVNNVATYGRLYNWYSVRASRGIAPEGWHVPSNDEWRTLADYLGGYLVAGGKMKTTGTIEEGTGLWHSPNTGATNESGFSAVPAGNGYLVETSPIWGRKPSSGLLRRCPYRSTLTSTPWAGA